jgi:hypothetical protein
LYDFPELVRRFVKRLFKPGGNHGVGGATGQAFVTDVTATTALFSALLRHFGYRPEITVLSLPAT